MALMIHETLHTEESAAAYLPTQLSLISGLLSQLSYFLLMPHIRQETQATPTKPLLQWDFHQLMSLFTPNLYQQSTEDNNYCSVSHLLALLQSSLAVHERT